MQCTTLPEEREILTDHVPIVTKLDLPAIRNEAHSVHNFRMAPWEEVQEKLKVKLTELPAPQKITTKAQFDEVVLSLTGALQDTIQAAIPISKPSPYQKRW